MEAKPVKGVCDKLLVEVPIHDARQDLDRTQPVKSVRLHQPQNCRVAPGFAVVGFDAGDQREDDLK
jgi:hypothetical protein